MNDDAGWLENMENGAHRNKLLKVAADAQLRQVPIECCCEILMMAPSSAC